MTNKKPEDRLGAKYELIPSGVSVASGILSVGTSATTFAVADGNSRFMRMFANGGNVYLKYGASASFSDFDEIIPDGQVVDVVYDEDELPGDYSCIADVACDLSYVIK